MDDDTQLLFLCFTNRCGSNYLAELLSSTGFFNRAEEFFNLEPIRDQAMQHELPDLSSYLHHISCLLKRNRWFCTKIGLWQLVTLAKIGLLSEIRSRSRFIIIEREDKLSQAISMSIAMQNGQWTTGDSSRIADEALVYDRERIRELLRNIETETRGFRTFFSDNEISHASLSYEAFVKNPHGSANAIGTWLGVPGLQVNLAQVGLERQTKPLKQEWRDRFLAGT